MVPKNPKNSGSTPTPCLDKAVLAQGGGGVRTTFREESHKTGVLAPAWCKPKVAERIPCVPFARAVFTHTCTCPAPPPQTTQGVVPQKKEPFWGWVGAADHTHSRPANRCQVQMYSATENCDRTIRGAKICGNNTQNVVCTRQRSLHDCTKHMLKNMALENGDWCNIPQTCRQPKCTAKLKIPFLVSKGAFSHSANYYVVHPGNTPENHPPTEACTINSKQHRGRRIQDPGAHGKHPTETKNIPVYQQRL